MAQRVLHKTVAEFLRQIEEARQEKANGNTAPLPGLPLDDFARYIYCQSVGQDRALAAEHRAYAELGLDFDQVQDIKAIRRGVASDEVIDLWLGGYLRAYAKLSGRDLPPHSSIWRQCAARFAQAREEYLRRVSERIENLREEAPAEWLRPPVISTPSASAFGGATKGVPTTPAAETVTPIAASAQTSILALFDRWRRFVRGASEETATCRRYRPAIEAFIAHLGHDVAERVTNRDVASWVETLVTVKGLSHKTVKAVHLTAVRALWRWATSQSHIPDVVITATVSVPKQQLSRSKGYLKAEAKRALDLARAVEKKVDGGEGDELVLAKRWLPLLAAYTGARIGELAQLRKEDVRSRDGIPLLHLTPKAGTIKTGIYREVPIHPVIVQEGFLAVVAKRPDGPLFVASGGRRSPRIDSRQAAEQVAQAVGNWLKKSGVVPDSVRPNHGFRHAFKTMWYEHGLPGRVADAIQGHSSGRASDGYGDISLAVMGRELSKLSYED